MTPPDHTKGRLTPGGHKVDENLHRGWLPEKPWNAMNDSLVARAITDEMREQGVWSFAPDVLVIVTAWPREGDPATLNVKLSAHGGALQISTGVAAADVLARLPAEFDAGMLAIKGGQA